MIVIISSSNDKYGIGNLRILKIKDKTSIDYDACVVTDIDGYEWDFYDIIEHNHYMGIRGSLDPDNPHSKVWEGTGVDPQK